ncbi:unnamed protein product [Bursaphelenchus okinawaensis]|uniref:Uncharacterized protein n=1 Tax=Bursaphelenchus okinawaensis TaxID=465554 RepID=A0A811LT38_9BILA|nr:unnamed protein product [Bursaphelenchus okinawaensis]CAG9127800.1 unnamed protein product [Bursaphelenchus okinawaensis]
MTLWLSLAKLLLFFSLFAGQTDGLKCFQCGYGLQADLEKFAYLFGVQNISPSLQQASTGEEDQWCGSKETLSHNESLIECPGACAFFTVSDGMTFIAGCANTIGGEMTYIDAKVLERRRNEYQFVVCTANGCNASPEAAEQSKKNPKQNLLKYDKGIKESPLNKTPKLRQEDVPQDESAVGLHQPSVLFTTIIVVLCKFM